MAKKKIIINKVTQVLVYLKTLSVKRDKNQLFSKSHAKQQNERMTGKMTPITLLRMHAEGLITIGRMEIES